MPAMQKNSWRRPRRNSLLVCLFVSALALLAGCADDRALIDRTLDKREAALNNKDLEAYLGLIAPDYVKAQPNFNPRAEMQDLFGQLAGINMQAYSRNITLEGRDRARVIQEYKMVLTNPQGLSKTISGVDHFMMKRSGVWPFTRWLIYQGLDGPPKKAAPPDGATPAAGAAPAATPQGGAQ